MKKNEVVMRRIVFGEKVECKYRKTCYGIVKHNDKFLVTYNERIKEYSLPGGGAEEGESLEDCIKREFAEEVGYEILRIGEFINIDCFWIRREGSPMETDANFLLIDVDLNNQINPTEPDHKALWVDKEMLRKITFPYQEKALEIFFNEIDKIDFWG
jgi:8-oxo-dGTP pyrophosphatase MutT (NUDIX family)